MHRHAKTHKLTYAMWQRGDWMNQVEAIREYVNALEADGRYPRNPESFKLWDRMREYGILPYAGGFYEQPEWFVDDCDWLDARAQLYDLEMAIETYEMPKVD